MNNELHESVMNYIQIFKDGVQEAAEQFLAYEISKGTELLIKIIDGLQWLLEAATELNKISDVEISEINLKLAEIVNALENQDYILVGDLLQYEILPMMEILEGKLGQ